MRVTMTRKMHTSLVAGSSGGSIGNNREKAQTNCRQPKQQRHESKNQYHCQQQQKQQQTSKRLKRQANSSKNSDNNNNNNNRRDTVTRFRKMRGGIKKQGQNDARALGCGAFGGIGFGLRCRSRAARRQRKLSRKVTKLLDSFKDMQPTAQLEIWKKMIDTHPFNLDQLRSIRTAIDGRIKVDIISNVPYEIARHIMSFLSPKDLCQAAQTCRSWRIVCEDNRLWREKCEEENLLDDELTLEELFKKKLFLDMKRQDNYIRNYLDTSTATKSEWKEAYLMHMDILRNWRRRGFKISEPYIAASPLPQQQENPQDQQQIVEEEAQGPSSPNYSPPRYSPERNWSPPPAIRSPQRNPDDLWDKNRILQLRCHEDSVITCLQYNPKTNTIVSGSDDQTLKVWCSKSGRCLTTLEGHQGGVWSSQLSPTDIVISGSTDRTLKVWKAHTGELLHTLHGHTSTVRCLALDGDRVVSGSRDTTLRLWNIVDGYCVQVLCGHSAAVRCVEFKNDTIVSGAYDHLVMVWNATTGTCVYTLECHLSRIYSLQFDGKTIASGSLDSTICIWDANTGRLRHQLEGHTSLTSKMQLRGNLLVSANADSYCKVWNVNTGECLQTLGGEHKHTSAITSVYFNNRHVVTSSDDGTVKLWDIRTGKFIRDLIILQTASKGGVVWRIRASYTKLICAVGSRTQTEDTHLLVLDFSEK